MAPKEKDSAEDLTRRAFLRRMAVIGFGVPIISSFTLDAVGHALEHQLDAQIFPNQHYPNQVSFASAPGQLTTNQFFGNQFYGNQAIPSQFFPNQAAESEFPGQYLSNQYPTGTYTPNQFTPQP